MDIFHGKHKDLVDGTGDWRNMQDIVRNTFVTIMKTIETQNQEISSMKNEITSLKVKLNEKVSRKDMHDFISASQHDQSIVFTRIEKEHVGMKQTIAAIRHDVELKLSRQYIDDRIVASSSRSKATRDADPPQAAERKADQHLMSMERDISHLRSKIELLFSKFNDIMTKVTDPLNNPRFVHDSMEDLRLQLLDRPTKLTMQQLLASKASIVDVRVHDDLKSTVDDLVSWKERCDKLSSRHNNLNHYKLEESIANPYDVASKSITSDNHNHSSSTSSMKSIDHLIEREKQNSQRLTKIEDALTREGRGYRVSEQLEVMSMVVEEQRSRLDSIITGSTIIPAIRNDISAHHDQISEIQRYLGLPQPVDLMQMVRSQINADARLIDNNISKLSSELAQLQAKVICAEKSQGIIDLRMNRMAEDIQASRHSQPVSPPSSDMTDVLRIVEKMKKHLHRDVLPALHRCDEHEVRLVALEEISLTLQYDAQQHSEKIAALERRTHVHTQDLSNVHQHADEQQLVKEASMLSDLRAKKHELKQKQRHQHADKI